MAKLVPAIRTACSQSSSSQTTRISWWAGAGTTPCRSGTFARRSQSRVSTALTSAATQSTFTATLYSPAPGGLNTSSRSYTFNVVCTKVWFRYGQNQESWLSLAAEWRDLLCVCMVGWIIFIYISANSFCCMALCRLGTCGPARSLMTSRGTNPPSAWIRAVSCTQRSLTRSIFTIVVACYECTPQWVIVVQDAKFIAAGGSGSNEAKIFDRSANNAVRDPNVQCDGHGTHLWFTPSLHTPCLFIYATACGYDRWSNSGSVHFGLVSSLWHCCCGWWRCFHPRFRCGSERFGSELTWSNIGFSKKKMWYIFVIITLVFVCVFGFYLRLITWSFNRYDSHSI